MDLTSHEKVAELLGIMLGDGCLSRSANKYTIYISGHKQDDYDYHLKNTCNLFWDIFDKKTKIGFRKDQNTLFIKFSDKTIFQQFEVMGVPVGKKYNSLKIPSMVNQERLLFSFVRGLFDTDGCVVLSKQHRDVPYYPRMEITSKSEGFLSDILGRLQHAGFYGSVRFQGTGYRLEIPGFHNLEKWMETIGSNNPKHLNKMASAKPL